MKLLGVPVSTKLVKSWVKLLVYPVAPFFMIEAFKHQVNSLVLTHSEFRATIQDLSFHDSYTTYAISSEATWVTLLHSQELQNFPEEIRLELLQLQAKLGRGQIYIFDDYKDLLKDDELEQAQIYTFDFEGKMMLELNHTLWHNFSFETQQRWLAKFISEDRSDCLSGTLSKNKWEHINKHFPALKHLLGFTDRSGPNCFATTLAAMLDVEQAKNISSLWLQTETFLRAIQERGYKKSDPSPNENLPQGSILVWEDKQSLQHACLYLGEGLVFNKDAQTWFAPRQILKLESALNNWKEFQVYAYTR